MRHRYTTIDVCGCNLDGWRGRLGLFDFHQQRKGQVTMEMTELVEKLLAG
jgi:hypothetical protein